MQKIEGGITRRDFAKLSVVALPVTAEYAWAFSTGQETERKRRGYISSHVDNIVLNLQAWERDALNFQSLTLPKQPLMALGSTTLASGRSLNRRQFIKAAAGGAALFTGIAALGSEAGRDNEGNREVFIEDCISRISDGLKGWMDNFRAINPGLLEDKRIPIDREDLVPQPKSSFPSFVLQNEHNFPIPLLDKLKNGKTVFIHLPGVGNERPDGVGAYQSELHIYEPWITKYYQARGVSEEQAAQKALELENIVLSYRNIEPQGIRLGKQIQVMLENGIVFLPWEMVPDDSPIAMALLAAAFIKNLPEDTEVILTGRSLGALAIRAFLKMQQEGFLDSSLEGKKLISTIGSNEVYPGDLVMNIFYKLSEGFNAHPEVGTNMMNQFYKWINRVFIDPDKDPGDIKVKYKAELEGDYNIQKAFEYPDPNWRLTIFLARRAAYLLGDPYYFIGTDGGKVNTRGTRAISIHSPQDAYAVNAQIKNAVDISVHVNPDLNGAVDKVVIGLGNTDIPFHIPDDPEWALSHIGERAHWPFSEVSSLILNTS